MWQVYWIWTWKSFLRIQYLAGLEPSVVVLHILAALQKEYFQSFPIFFFYLTSFLLVLDLKRTLFFDRFGGPESVTE